MEISGRDKWKEYERAAARKIFPREMERSRCWLQSQDFFFVHALGPHVVFSFYRAESEIRMKKLVHFLMWYTFQNKYSHEEFLLFTRVFIRVYVPLVRQKIHELFLLLSTWTSGLQITMYRFNGKSSHLVILASVISYRANVRESRILSQKASRRLIYWRCKVIIFPRTFSKTLFYSHHPLTNKILLLANGCYLASFNRKQPFLCSFPPLDHFDPIQRRPT